MNTNTAEVLTKGMESMLEKMSIVDVEQFIFLVKSEGFDYTKWQRDYFGNMSKEDMDKDMDKYFSEHPYNGDPAKLI